MPINKHRWTKSGGGGGGAASSVPASGVTGIADNEVVRGDNSTGIQGSLVTINDTGQVEVIAGTATNPSIAFPVAVGDVGFYNASGYGVIFTSGSPAAASLMLYPDLVRSTSSGAYTWSSTSDPVGVASDTGLARTSAGVVKVTNGDTGLGFLQQAGQIRRTSNNTIATNTTTLASDTQLTVNVAAGRSYRFEAELYATTVNTSGIKVAMGGTATHTAIIYDIYINSTSTPAFGTAGRLTALGTGVGLTASGTAAHVSIIGTTTVNAAGTFVIQAAQNAETGSAESVILLQGSTFEVTDFV